jgi:hypothetical protein
VITERELRDRARRRGLLLVQAAGGYQLADLTTGVVVSGDRPAPCC